MEYFTIIYYIQGLIRSYIPFMEITRDYPDKIIFPLIPKFSDNGEVFWLKKCVKKSYYALELGFCLYEYKSLEKYSGLKNKRLGKIK